VVTLQFASQPPEIFFLEALASLLRFVAKKGLFVSNYNMRGNIAAFRHGF
jgi:hypothetical protein